MGFNYENINIEALKLNKLNNGNIEYAIELLINELI